MEDIECISEKESEIELVDTTEYFFVEENQELRALMWNNK